MGTLARVQGTETTDGAPSPAVDRRLAAGTTDRGRRATTLVVWADIATRVHTSWIRRDRVWLVFPILLAFLVRPH